MGSNIKFGLPYPHLTQICHNLQLFPASSVFHPSSSSSSLSPLSVMFRLEISFTSISYCHTCTIIWPLKQYFDSHFFRYIIFSLISLGTPLSTCNVPQMYKCFFFPHKHFTQFNTVIVIVLVQDEQLCIQKNLNSDFCCRDWPVYTYIISM